MKPFFIRSLLQYSADTDQSIPARGLSLQFGDVVAVLDASDTNWWRACPIEIKIKYNSQDGSINTNEEPDIRLLTDRQGLIPSDRRFKRKLLKMMIRRVNWNVSALEDKVQFAPDPREYLDEQEYETLMKDKEKNSKRNQKKNKRGGHNNNNMNGYYDQSNYNEEESSLMLSKWGSEKNLAAQSQAENLDNSAVAYTDEAYKKRSILNALNSSSTTNGNNENNNNNDGTSNSSSSAHLSPQHRNNMNNYNMNAINSASINTLNMTGLSLGLTREQMEKKEAYQFVRPGWAYLRPRPVMMLGMLRDKLHGKLLQDNEEKFAFVVPHTTRPIRENEIDHQDYHFVTHAEMQKDIDDKKFIEAGVYKKNLYGTSVEAIRNIADQNKFALLDVSGGAINNLLQNNIDPIVILIKMNDGGWLLQNGFAQNEQQAEMKFIKEKQLEEQFLEFCTQMVPVTNLDSVEDIKIAINRMIDEIDKVPVVWKKIGRPETLPKL